MCTSIIGMKQKKYFKKEKLNISEQKSDGIRIKLNDL